MDYGYLNHIYTNNLPQTREILKQFQDLIKSYAAIDGYDRLNMVEFYTNGEGSVPYYNCSDFPFNFNLLFDANSDGSVSADRIKFGIEDWLSHVPEGKLFFREKNPYRNLIYLEHFVSREKGKLGYWKSRSMEGRIQNSCRTHGPFQFDHYDLTRSIRNLLRRRNR